MVGGGGRKVPQDAAIQRHRVGFKELVHGCRWEPPEVAAFLLKSLIQCSSINSRFIGDVAYDQAQNLMLVTLLFDALNETLYA